MPTAIPPFIDGQGWNALPDGTSIELSRDEGSIAYFDVEITA